MNGFFGVKKKIKCSLIRGQVENGLTDKFLKVLKTGRTNNRRSDGVLRHDPGTSDLRHSMSFLLGKLFDASDNLLVSFRLAITSYHSFGFYQYGSDIFTRHQAGLTHQHCCASTVLLMV